MPALSKIRLMLRNSRPPSEPPRPVASQPASATTAAEHAVLGLVRRLARELHEHRITYCLWKGTYSLRRVAAGEKDVDLLVSRADALALAEILARLGFKEALAPRDERLPGIVDYFGYDRDANRIVHLHLHYQLVLGHGLSGTYHLPIEKGYLASAVDGPLFRVPLPEFEFILFVVRMVLDQPAWNSCGSSSSNVS